MREIKMKKYLNIIELVAVSGTVLSIMQTIFWFALYASTIEGINPMGIGILFIVFSVEFTAILVLVEIVKIKLLKQLLK